MEIHCDNEFHKAMDKFASKQTPVINMNYASAIEHVPRAERNNRTIQERVRSNYHQLPFVHLPRILVKYMVIEAAKKLNFISTKNGVSKHYSPRMILHKENIDYERHCKYVLGEYVQAHEDKTIKNTNAPRLLDCLYLRPTTNHQGGHELLHLQTNITITSPRVIAVAITPSVIRMVHNIAKKDNMPLGLKIKNQANVLTFDTSWTAGVDCEEEFFNDEEDDSDYESSKSSEEESQGEELDEMDDNGLVDCSKRIIRTRK